MDTAALDAWIAEALVAYAWMGREPPPLPELLLMAAQALKPALH